MAFIDMNKETAKRIRVLPATFEFEWCDGDGPRDVTAQLRNAGQTQGQGTDLHLYQADDFFIKTAIPEALAPDLCHGLHYVEIIRGACDVCVSYPVFLDYSCVQPEVTCDTPKQEIRVKCNGV